MNLLEKLLSKRANLAHGGKHAARRRSPLAAALTASVLCLSGASVAAQTTTIVDVGTGGVLPSCPEAQQFCYSVLPAVTPDARYIAFESTMPGLVAGPPSASAQILLHDRKTCTTTRISETAGGQPANSSAGSASISADGTIVTFTSSATNLVAGVTGRQIYAYDGGTSSMELVSRSDSGVPGNAESGGAGISADGRWVVFTSTATNLVPGGTDGTRHVFVYDRDLQSTQIISRSLAGDLGDDISNRPHVSGNGRFITFDSVATNLDAAPDNGTYQAYLLDRDVDGSGIFDEVGNVSLTRVSVNNDGESSNKGVIFAVATDDGLKVAFASAGTNLVSGDTNGKTDVFVHNIISGQTTRESVGPGGAQTTHGSYGPSFSADGRYLTFHGTAPELVAGGLNGHTHVFRRDLTTGENIVASRNTEGDLADLVNELGVMSADGQTVVFDSAGMNMVPGGLPDITPRVHIFARDFSPRIDACGITPNPWNDIVIPINDGNEFDVTANATAFTVPVIDNGEIVIGVSFEGTIYIDPLSGMGIPRHTQLTVTNPDIESYIIGGQPPPGTPWDFQSQTGGQNVTYQHGVGGDAWGGDGFPDFAIPNAPVDGDWQFSFKRVGGSAFAKWRDVTITLHTVVPPTIDVQPDSLSSTLTPGGSDYHTLGLANTGGLDLEWEIRTATSGCALPNWITINPISGTVLPNDLQTSTVTFDATGLALGNYDANLCVGSNDDAYPLTIVPLSLTVVEPPAPELMFDPDALDFGNVPLGQTSSPQLVTLLNIGPARATGLVFQSPGSGFSVVSSQCGSSLAANASCESMITFTASANGLADAVWHVSGSQGAMADVHLSGTGVSSDLQFDPAILDFGSVGIGSTSAVQTTTLRNEGAADATAIAFSTPGNGYNFDARACRSLSAGAECEVRVTFTASTVGIAEAEIHVTSDQGSSATLNLTGEGSTDDVIFKDGFE